MSGRLPSVRLVVCAAVIALAAALAPAMLLGEATAQTDDSLPEFNPDGKLLLKDDGNSTILPSGSGKYSLPQDVAIDPDGRIFLADRGNNRVVVLDRDYNYSRSLGNIDPATRRDASAGVGQGELKFPAGVALNSTHVFVAERGNDRLSVFTLDGSFVRHIDGPGQVPLPGFGVVSFNQARGVTVTPEGIAYLSFDASAVPYYYPNGTQKGILLGANADGMDVGRGGILAVAVPGSSTSGSIVRFLNMSDDHREVFTIGTVGDSTVEGDFKRPRDVKFSSDGRLLAVADSQNDRIQVFRLNTTDDGRPTGLADTLPVLVIPSLLNPIGVALDSASHRLAVTGSNPPTLWVYEFALPAVKSVAAVPDPANAGNAINASVLPAGSSALVNVTFNTDLAKVNTTAGVPYLALGPDRNATIIPYNYSETTRTLQFTYTVQMGDTAANFEYNPVTALMLNGSAITAGQRNVTALTALPWTGPAGGSLLAAHGIAVDTVKPVLAAVYSPNASAAYTNGSRIVVALNYSEPVWAVGPDDPSLALSVIAEGGGVAAPASYLSGNGTTTLSFSYDVQPGDSAPGGLRHSGTGALSAGSVVDAAGNAADLALPESSDFGPSIMLDTVQPRVLEVNSTSPAGTYGIGQTIDIAVTFAEDVTVDGGPVLALDTNPPRNASYVQEGTGNDAVLLFRYEVQPDDGAPGGLRHAGTDALIANGSSIVDAAGNVANRTLPAPSEFAGPAVMLDAVQPRVFAVNTTLPSGTYGIGQTIDIAVTFDEDVTVTGSPVLALATNPSRNATYVQDTDGDAELVFTYVVESGDNTAAEGLRYAGMDALSASGGSIADMAGNAANLTLSPPGPLAGRGIWLDAVAPRVVSVEPDSPGGTYRAGQSVDIAVVFDENVTVTGSPVLALATTPSKNALYVPDTDGDAELLFRYEVEAGDSAPGGLRYAGAGALSAGGGSIADAVGNAADLTLPAPSPLAGIMINTASMGGGPGNQTGGGPGNQTGGGPGNQTGGGPGNQTGGGPTTVAIGPGGVADGQGDFVDRGPGVNVTIDVSGLPGAGTAGGTVQFPQGGATVTASFGSVSFPPGTVATSVPEDGLLVLRVVDVADDTLPSNSSIQRGLAYEGSGAVVLQSVVEVGDENTRIEFDKPVRISLEGQAGGRAFYIAGADGQITPIDDACGADDTDRVDRHLNGTGECRIESDGDMVIYTYHLTRFGTVKAVNEAAPLPVYYTCSVALEKPSLEIDDARLKDYSAPAPQKLFNTGSAQFERVGIEATRWQAGSGSNTPPGAGMPSLPSPASGTGNGTASSALVARVDTSLPAGLTEVSETDKDGPYASVGEGTAVAGALGGGDVKQLWLRLNLTQYDAVQGDTITQSVTYSAQCTGP